jgi:hypothetical protein
VRGNDSFASGWRRGRLGPLRILEENSLGKVLSFSDIGELLAKGAAFFFQRSQALLRFQRRRLSVRHLALDHASDHGHDSSEDKSPGDQDYQLSKVSQIHRD